MLVWRGAVDSAPLLTSRGAAHTSIYTRGRISPSGEARSEAHSDGRRDGGVRANPRESGAIVRQAVGESSDSRVKDSTRGKGRGL